MNCLKNIRIISSRDENLTKDETEEFQMSGLKLTYEEAADEYELRRETKLRRLIANRELPVLMRAREIIEWERK